MAGIGTRSLIAVIGDEVRVEPTFSFQLFHLILAGYGHRLAFGWCWPYQRTAEAKFPYCRFQLRNLYIHKFPLD